ncbi:hypothetical protein LAZ67_17002127 [Cordylochernes scorpioides]|uniref:Uncharacterized protein n=1 Tax=Cordylochernes scorpioides TaxID=51811 RepID=A0ABY6LDS9_9ARAC|nr:hypothetical protein LAZ67_17002127 [Cordylochernes scorpioides]
MEAALVTDYQMAHSPMPYIKVQFAQPSPNSPDLASSDFHLFPHLNQFVSGKHFMSNEEVERTLDEYFNSLPNSFTGINTNIVETLDKVC